MEEETVMSDVADGKERTEEGRDPASHPVSGREEAPPAPCWGLECKKDASRNKGRWANVSFSDLNLEELRPLTAPRDTRRRAMALSLVILMTPRAYRPHLKASQITEERKTRATYIDTSLFGLKRTRCAES